MTTSTTGNCGGALPVLLPDLIRARSPADGNASAVLPGDMMSPATELTAYRRRHIDLSLTARDLCQRMPAHPCASRRPTPLIDFRSTHDPRTCTHVGFTRN
jgi:hypothetical protein